MKGRVTYDQLNTAVKSINAAVTGKYKILQQPVKSLSNAARKLHQRFKDQETKDTKGTINAILNVTSIEPSECLLYNTNTGCAVSLWGQGSAWSV